MRFPHFGMTPEPFDPVLDKYRAAMRREDSTEVVGVLGVDQVADSKSVTDDLAKLRDANWLQFGRHVTLSDRE